MKKENSNNKKKLFTMLLVLIIIVGIICIVTKIVKGRVVEKELCLYDKVTNYKTEMKYMSNSGFSVTNEITEEDSFPIIVFENSEANIKMELQYCLITDEDFEADKEEAKKLDDFKEYNFNGYTGYGNTNDGMMFVNIKLLGNNQSEYNKNSENIIEGTEINAEIPETTSASNVTKETISEIANMTNLTSDEITNMIESMETSSEEETITSEEENENENGFSTESGVMLKIFIERCDTSINTNVFEVFNSENVQNILNTMVFTK